MAGDIVVNLINIDLNLEDFTKALTVLQKKLKDDQIKKTFVKLPQELYSNLEIMRNLYHDDKLQSMQVNDSYLRKKLKGVKTDIMEKVRAYKFDCKKYVSQKDFDFDKLSLAIYKIKELKDFNAMSDSELKQRKFLVAKRVKNIIQAIVALVKNK